MTAISDRREVFRKILLVGGLALGAAAAVWMASFVPNADWSGTYEPAALQVLQGHSPYNQPLYLNPPWAILLFLPFLLFPQAISRGLILVCSLAVLIYTTWRLHAPRVATVALLLSPTAVGSLLAGNLDMMVLLGLFLQPAWGLLLLMIKPQIGVGVALYYLTDAWRTNKAVGLLRTFGPVLLAYLISGLLFPIWLDRMIQKPLNVWNRTLFPYGIPIGLFFLWLAIRRRNVFFALASTPFFSPYLTFYTYLIVQIGLLHEEVEKVIRRDVLQILLCLFLWTIMLVFRL